MQVIPWVLCFWGFLFASMQIRTAFVELAIFWWLGWYHQQIVSVDWGCNDLSGEVVNIAGCKYCWSPCLLVGSHKCDLLTKLYIFYLLFLGVQGKTIFQDQSHLGQWLPLWRPMVQQVLERFHLVGWNCWWGQNCLWLKWWCGPLVCRRFDWSIICESWSMICWFPGRLWCWLCSWCLLGRLLSIEGSFGWWTVC